MEFLEKDLGSLMEFYTSSRGGQFAFGSGFFTRLGNGNAKWEIIPGHGHGAWDGKWGNHTVAFFVLPFSLGIDEDG
jgi:hypothetical protein